MKDIYFTPDSPNIAEFEALIARRTMPEDVPLSARIEESIPIYDMETRAPDLQNAQTRVALMSEWTRVLRDGAGIVVLAGAYADTAPIDAATGIYERLIAEAAGGGDHFAVEGANDRVWNSLQKLCMADPSVYAHYFGNPAIATISEAWLGPGYQMTAQVNNVRPGGKPQSVHRDYHLGFMSEADAMRFPAHAHDMSPLLTLQGAIAHGDMPVESGPTRLLPYSQLYRAGYVAYHREAFAEAFEEHAVQLPLKKGDAVFFNPAVFHGAGENRSTDIRRMANLLQVGSAMGRSIEAIDRVAMCKALYPVLLEDDLDAAEVDAAIAATAEGYAFPTNLDTDPPVGGLAPRTQAALFRDSLAERRTPETFAAALDAQALRKLP